MPAIIECPHCQRQLKVQDANLGQSVRCPACKQIFTAAALPSPPAAEDVPDVSAFQVGDAPPKPAPRRLEPDDPMNFERPLRRFEDDDEEFIEGKPHRGGLILTLGILTLLFGFCCPLICWIIGGIGLNMAEADLRAMSRRDMDRSGRGMTQAGKTLMKVGFGISIVMVMINVLFRFTNLFH